MKKIYIQPITKYSRFEADPLLLDASQGEWADSKERGYVETTEDEEYYHHAEDNNSWGKLW